MKIKNEKTDKKTYRKKTRRKYDCPPKLKELLKKMGWIKPEISLISFNDALGIVRIEQPKIDDFEVFSAAFEQCLKHTSEKLKNYVHYGMEKMPTDKIEILKLSTGDFLTNLNIKISRYEDFRLSRLKLSRLAKIYETYTKRGLNPDYTLRAINEDFGGTGIFQLDENGIIHIINDSFGEAINGAILDRIRRCQICDRVFWAKNKNSNTCTPNHGDILRNRQARLRNKEQRAKNNDLINEKRRENYASKVELKHGKERRDKRNGNL